MYVANNSTKTNSNQIVKKGTEVISKYQKRTHLKKQKENTLASK